jgi:hypothetical protein
VFESRRRHHSKSIKTAGYQLHPRGLLPLEPSGNRCLGVLFGSSKAHKDLRRIGSRQTSLMR